MVRESMYNAIDKYGVNSKEALIESQKYDEVILKQMLQDPKIEVMYLKRIIKSKDKEISSLQRRIVELSDIAACAAMNGETVKNAIASVMLIALKEGILDEA